VAAGTGRCATGALADDRWLVPVPGLRIGRRGGALVAPAALAHAASYSYDRRIFVIQTDGEENSSIEYTLVQVRDLIARMEADDWQIIFLGAGIDAFANARNMNINTGYTVTYSPTAGSAYAAGQVLTSTVRNYTTSGVTATANLVISPEGKVDDGKGKPPKGKPSKNP